ncbi:MAG: hypothetical protein UR17_C0001G0826 [Candidatus Woesebacteria bacterium GW2011_GWF1_31_35]|uniref:Uncharacterized protein n=1 Tax=Candidatus Woesebacteria bacterium GW2011_GWC2_31_9 TaxID=1618586 RepID=A0A0G0BLH3_9BACT|nr:MAG: hypothetical protein UR17_C0001G0826 [Candidatus Woesebacteria bacterium GW2011_GWF1_31_35]KKP23629.1 MAG: hypothetical protein UR11_C0001G0603 [Candidatus Woesebacteria bacterium GW2011_GWC1_30_29]KKP26990.1 MAG: hypothetical protein UR13_C0001G0085 [Candidatus Woesebacteria bacterium GW2011_GWD1_31_12]KKP27904.1 MAG: hypothetical protein UR16_C0002G0234 [Candidatus Woesebacteria bacterium GW2011_GWB1_31_29]KKP31907.1 MAG: hypothetical protein UR21_C0004G0043 [Candidatus Woesebacteria 
MAIEILKRELDKPLMDKSPKRNAFYTREYPLTDEEKKRLQTFRNILPKNRYSKSV